MSNNRTCRFVCLATEGSQEWVVTEDGEPIAPVMNIPEEQRFIFYQRDNGKYYAISPEFRNIIIGILGEFIDITDTKGEEPKKVK